MNFNIIILWIGKKEKRAGPLLYGYTTIYKLYRKHGHYMAWAKLRLVPLIFVHNVIITVNQRQSLRVCKEKKRARDWKSIYAHDAPESELKKRKKRLMSFAVATTKTDRWDFAFHKYMARGEKEREDPFSINFNSQTVAFYDNT